MVLLVLLNLIGIHRLFGILHVRHIRQKEILRCLKWIQGVQGVQGARKTGRQSGFGEEGADYTDILVEARRKGLASFHAIHKLHLLLEKRLGVFRRGNSLFLGFVLRSMFSVLSLSLLLEFVRKQFHSEELATGFDMLALTLLLILWTQVILVFFLSKLEKSELEWHAEGAFSTVNWNWLRALFLGEVPREGLLSRYRDWQRKRQLGGAAQLKSLSDYTTMEAEKNLNAIENKLIRYQGLSGVLEFVIVLPGILLVSIQFLSGLGSEIWTDSLFF